MENDALIECPYDKAHMITPNRMPYHLIKCRKNFPTMDLAVCPFDASHEVLKAELKYHMMNCPNKVLLERECSFEALLGALTDTPIKKGYTELPRYVNSQRVNFDEQENWDTDINPRTYSRNSRFRHESQGALEHNLRWPVSHGQAAEMSSSFSHCNSRVSSLRSPQLLSDNSTLCLGWGRGKPAMSTNTEASSSACSEQQNVRSSMSLIGLGLPTFAKAVGRGQSLLPTSKT
uniref:CHHC U11-48K-type domain-containing protein n=1 Tax=Arion vulgaris TaxID=1028688 RepID=A0A0B6ZKG0_9EUPU